MMKYAAIVGLVVATAGFGAAAPNAAGAEPVGATAAAEPATDLSAQTRRPLRRRPAERILIYPAPAPRYVRRCTDWYAIERRASGPTVTPHMRCWWTRG